MLVREDIVNKKWKIYTSTSPYGKPPQQNVLAFGGFGKRKPYSYISDKFAYNNVIVGSKMLFEPVYADKTLIQKASQN